MILKVYIVIEEELNKDWGVYQEEMDILKDMCQKSEHFEFVPVAYVFLHFLLSTIHIDFVLMDNVKKFVSFLLKILEEILCVQ